MKRYLALLLPLMFVLSSCKDTSAPTAPKPPVTATEPAALKQQTASVEQALVAGNGAALKSLIVPKYVDIYASAIDGAGTKLAGFGELFKARSLVALDSVNAVYQIAYNGNTYEVSFTLDVDGSWRLTHF